LLCFYLFNFSPRRGEITDKFKIKKLKKRKDNVFE
jgi:hypothetical protein